MKKLGSNWSLNPANDDYENPVEKRRQYDKWYSFQKMKEENGIDLTEGNVIRNGSYNYVNVLEIGDDKSVNNLEKDIVKFTKNEEKIQKSVDLTIKNENEKQEEVKRQAIELANNEDNIQDMVDSIINDEIKDVRAYEDDER